ncbi:PDZ domain-containing protein [Gimesia sp.]|uniref:PDZ domain-containing protein n=1 Tax=Gimesia sp. TaxID=2024833 RepID=UPI003A8D7FD3
MFALPGEGAVFLESIQGSTMKQCRRFITGGLIFSLLAGQAAFADDQPVSAKKPDQANVKQNNAASAKQAMSAVSKEASAPSRAKARIQVTSSPTGVAHLRNFVGIVTEPVEAALSAQLKDMMKEGQGVSVKLVLPDSPARQSGLKMYDVLTTFNGKAITSSDTLRKFVLDSPKGSNVKLGVIRASKQQTIEVTLSQKLYRNYKFTVKPVGNPPPPKKPEDKDKPAPTLDSAQEGPVASRSGEKNTKGRELPLGFNHAPVTTTQNLCLLFVGSIKDGYSVKISYQDETDTLQTYQLNGSIDEITEQTIDMPSHVQMMINERLQELKMALQGKASFRLQVKPYMQGKNRFTRVFLSRTTKERSVRMVELDHHLGNRPTLNVNQILGNQVFTSELKQLTPAIQEQIRAALHRVRIPTIQIHADNPI